MTARRGTTGGAGVVRRPAYASEPVRGGVLMVGAMMLFAVMAVSARLASRQMGAGQLVVLRFVICGAGVGALWAAGRATIAPHNLRLLALRGILGGSAVVLYFIALRLCGNAGTAALLNSTSPIFTSLFAWWFLDERPSGRLAIGIALGFAGVLLVLWTGHSIRFGWGEAAGLASAVLSASAVTTVRAARAYDNAATILLSFSIAGALIATPVAAVDWHGASAAIWTLTLLMGVSSLFAQLMMTHAFGLVTAGQGALYQQLTPLFTFGLGLVLLGEHLTGSAVLGAVLTLSAVTYAAWPRRGTAGV